MKLDPGSTPDKPSVSKTSTRAIIWVMIEVCLFTALFGFVVNALTGLQVKGDEVNAPGQEGVRDYILRSMAQIFVSHSLGATAGSIAATVVPVFLALLVKDMVGLADLYAVGVVGAIATNLGASATDKKLGLTKVERWLMAFTFLVMCAFFVVAHHPQDVHQTGSTPPLYLLFVREQPAITGQDRQRKWQDDKEANEIFTYAKNQAQGQIVLPCYVVSDSPATMIVEVTATIGASRLILGAPPRGSLVNILRGNIIREVAKLLPDDIALLVFA